MKFVESYLSCNILKTLKPLVVKAQTAFPVIMKGGRGVAVEGVGLIMNWNASCVKMRKRAQTLKNHHKTCILEVRNTWPDTGQGQGSPSF